MTKLSKEKNPTQEYLLQVKLCDAHIESLLEEKARLVALREKITASWSLDKVAGSNSQDKMGDCTAKILDLEKEIDAAVDAFVDKKREVSAVIERVKNASVVKVLRKRYLDYKTWEQIACEMNYTYQGVCKLHGRALQAVAAVMEGEQHG